MADETRLAAIRQLLASHGPSLRKFINEPRTARRLDVQLAEACTELLTQLDTQDELMATTERYVKELRAQLDAQAQTIATLTKERDEACKNSEWLDVRRDRLEARLTQLTEGLTKLKAVLSSDCNYGDSCAAGEAEPLVDALLADPPTTPAR